MEAPLHEPPANFLSAFKPLPEDNKPQGALNRASIKPAAARFGRTLASLGQQIIKKPAQVVKAIDEKRADAALGEAFEAPKCLSSCKIALQTKLEESIDRFLSHISRPKKPAASAAHTEKLSEVVNHSMLPKVDPRSLDGDEVLLPTAKLKGRNAHAKIDYAFTSQGIVQGQESIQRIPVVEQRKTILEAKIAFLENQLEKFADQAPRVLKINQELGACRVDLQNCQRSKNSWLGSNASRDILNQREFFETRTKIIPGAVNHRSQTVTAHLADGQIVTETFHRFGAVWDPRNGLLNLKELSELLSMRQSNAEDKLAAAKQRIESRLNELEEMKGSYTSKNQLALIEESQSRLQGLLRPQENPEFKKTVDFIADRRRFLREQLLDPLLGQLKDNAAKLQIDADGNKTFPLFHLGLLNCQANQDFQATGWAHLEKNQMADMAQIFKEMQGCEIVISDQPHSFFGIENAEGKPILYLARGDAPHKDLKVGDKIALSTCFMNISVQGHTVNDGIQRQINQEQIATLQIWSENIRPADKKKSVQTALAAIQSRLAAGESSFELAIDISMCAKEMAAISEGCLSCKDRGGTLAEWLAIKMISSNRMQMAKSAKERQQIQDDLRAFVQKIFSKDSPCTRVVEDNTGVTCVKVEVWRVPKLSAINILRNGLILVWQNFTGGLEVKPE